MVLYFSSWSLNSFNSVLRSINGLSLEWIQIYDLILLRNQLNFLSVIKNLFRIDWLIIYFSLRSIVLLSNYFFSIICWLNDLWVVNNIILLFLNSQLLFNHVFLRLNISFSDSGSPRDGNRNLSAHSLIIYNWLILNFFGVNWSSDWFFSDNRSLDYSLFDYRLRNDLFSDDRLRNNLSWNNWLRNDFLSLNDLRSGIQNLFLTFHSHKGLTFHLSTCLHHYFLNTFLGDSSLRLCLTWSSLG